MSLRQTENVFREALKILREKRLSEMTEGELATFNAASIPLTILPEFNDMTTVEGLEYLAELFEETELEAVREEERGRVYVEQ